MDLLKSLTGSLAKSQGLSSDLAMAEDEVEADDDEDMDIDIATFVTRAASANRSMINPQAPLRRIKWGQENDYV